MTTMTIRMNAARSDVTVDGGVFNFDPTKFNDRKVVGQAMKSALGFNVVEVKPKRRRVRKPVKQAA